jgi:hypothetical protein
LAGARKHRYRAAGEKVIRKTEFGNKKIKEFSDFLVFPLDSREIFATFPLP